MSKNIKFVHCSDLHLGANPYMLRQRFEDMKKVFEYAMKFAIAKEVDFVVIAGDLFDKKILNADTLDQAIEVLKELNEKNIPIYVTEGNHDMATYVNKYSWLEFMSQKGYIKLLVPKDGMIEKWSDDSKSGTYIETDDLIIYGLGYPGVTSSKYIEKIADQYVDNPDNKVVITMLHTGIDRFVTEGMGGLREEELKSIIDKSDYIALGHIHQRYESVENKYYNPGSLENTSIPQKHEEKGFFLVDIDSDTKEVKFEFEEVENRRILNITIDLSEIDSVTDSNKYVFDMIAKICEGKSIGEEEKAILQIKLKGEIGSSGTLVDIKSMKDELIEKFGFMYVEIQNKLVSKRDKKEYDFDNATREEIDRCVIDRLVKNEGFEDDEIDDIVALTIDLKNVAQEQTITLDMQEGVDIKEKILKIIRSQQNKEND